MAFDEDIIRLWRLFLQDIAKEVKHEEFRDIKLILGDKLTARDWESISEPVDLFELLEDKRLISEDDTALLRELFRKAEYTELIPRLNEYEANRKKYLERVSMLAGSMGLVEEDVRQRLRQRFSHLPEPVFNECLRTNPTNLNLCITQLKERSQAQELRDPMCAVDPAQHHVPQPPPPQHLQHHHQQQHLQQQRPEGSQDGRLNSDGWFELTWPPKMNAVGDKVDPQPSRTPEANEPTGGWQGYRDLGSFRPPLQASKISVNLQDSEQRAKSPSLVQPIKTPSPSRSRTYDAGNGGRTPGTPESIGLESSITLPGISHPLRDRTPSPFTNPFFPPIDHNALRASLQSNGPSSPGVAYQYPRSASPRRHAPPNQNTSTSPLHYNSPVAPMPIVGQPNVLTSHPVAPHQHNTPEPRQDLRRKISKPEHRVEVNSPHPQSGGGGVSGVNMYDGAARQVSNTQAPPSYPTSTQRPPAAQGPESTEYRKRMGIQQELRYNQALIMHQNVRKERLRKDLTEEQVKLDRMRGEIKRMEHDLHNKIPHRSPFPSNEQLSKMREEKKQLQIDIECMNKEIDTLTKQGFTNPYTQEYFYANIDQGPTGPIPPGPPVPPDMGTIRTTATTTATLPSTHVGSQAAAATFPSTHASSPAAATTFPPTHASSSAAAATFPPTHTTSSAAEESTLPQDNLESDRKLDKLSKHMPKETYTTLCTYLGIGYSEAKQILRGVTYDYREATRDCLARWKIKTGGNMDELETILQCAEVGDLVKYIKIHQPLYQEYFYANIDQGPTGPIPSGPPVPPNMRTTTTTTTAVAATAATTSGAAATFPPIRASLQGAVAAATFSPIYASSQAGAAATFPPMHASSQAAAAAAKVSQESRWLHLDTTDDGNQVHWDFLTDSPQELTLRDNEAVISCGIRFSPSRTKLSKPIKVTLDHDAHFSNPRRAEIVFYTRKKDSKSFERIPASASSYPRCDVRVKDLDLYVDHFSDWWIVAVLTRYFVGKRVNCTPYVLPPVRKEFSHCVFLCIYDDLSDVIHKIDKEMTEYIQLFRSQPMFIEWKHGDINIKLFEGLKGNEKEIDEQRLGERDIYLVDRKQFSFEVKPLKLGERQKFLKFTLNQKESLSNPTSMKFPLPYDATFPSTRASSPPAEESTLSPEESTLSQDNLESDRKLDKLSKHMPTETYTTLCTYLGIDYSESKKILRGLTNDYREATRDCLARWKTRTGGNMDELETILQYAEVGDLVKYIK